MSEKSSPGPINRTVALLLVACACSRQALHESTAPAAGSWDQSLPTVDDVLERWLRLSRGSDGSGVRIRSVTTGPETTTTATTVIDVLPLGDGSFVAIALSETKDGKTDDDGWRVPWSTEARWVEALWTMEKLREKYPRFVAQGWTQVDGRRALKLLVDGAGQDGEAWYFDAETGQRVGLEELEDCGPDLVQVFRQYRRFGEIALPAETEAWNEEHEITRIKSVEGRGQTNISSVSRHGIAGRVVRDGKPVAGALVELLAQREMQSSPASRFLDRGVP